MSATVQQSRTDYLVRDESITGRQPVKAAARKTRSEARQKPSRATIIRFAVFGIASALLYTVFFLAIDPLFKIYTAQNALGAAAVIATALTFSLVHGTFAKHLLSVLGLKALK